jgi:hypothetical protein
MPTNDVTVTLPSGLGIDSGSLTNASGATVERERAVIADNTLCAGVAAVSLQGFLQVAQQSADTLERILAELRLNNLLLQSLMPVQSDDLDTMASDIAGNIIPR